MNKGNPRQYVVDSSALLEDKLWPELAQGLPVFTPAQLLLGHVVYPRSQDKAAATKLENGLWPELASKPLPGQPRLPFKGRQVELTKRIRMVPDISAAARKYKLAKPYMVWLCLREIDQKLYKGRGWMDYELALDLLAKFYGYRRRMAKVHLTQGMCVFFCIRQSTKRTTIRIKGIAAVCAFLGMDSLRDRKLKDFPVSGKEVTGVQSRHSLIYTSCLPARANYKKLHPVPRELMAQITGVNRRQQLRYDKKAKTRVIPQFIKTPNDPTIPLEWNQLNNIYVTRVSGAVTGQLRHVDRLLKSFSGCYKEESFDGKAHSSKVLRRFFLDAKSYLKAKDKGEVAVPCFIRLPARDRQIKGRPEWDLIAC